MAYQIYKVRDPQGNIREIRGPAGASDDEVIAQAKRLLGEPAAATPVTVAAPSEIPGPRAEPSFMRQVGQGLINVGAGAVRGAGSIGATLLTPLDYAEAALRRRAGEDVTGAQLSQERRAGITSGLQQLVGAEPESLAFRGGQLAGEIAGTAGVGGVMAAPVARVAPKVAAALQSGGMAAGTPLALRAGAGAATGAAGAALVEPESIGAGALTGAGVSAVAPPVIGAAAKVLGKLADLRKVAYTRSGEFARKTLGTDVAQTINALRAAPPGVSVAEATANIQNPAWQAFVKDSLEKTPEGAKYLNRLATMTDEQAVGEFNRLAGGATETARRTARALEKETLTDITSPARQAALTRANQGRRIAELETEAALLEGRAADKVAEVRKLIKSGEVAEAAARLELIKKGVPTGFARYTYPGELATKADEWASKAAEGSLDLGQGAQFARSAIESLREAGLAPLKTNEILGRISSTLRDPTAGVAGNDVLERSLKNVADDLAKWTNNAGVIDARALESIRKNSVNATVRQLNPTMDATSQKRLAAGVLSRINPMIDDAIESAGGVGWKSYLEDYAAGMRKINESKLVGEAARLWKNDKNGFVQLVTGESPDVVEKILGPKNYDIAKELADDVMSTLTKHANRHLARVAASEQASEGAKALTELIKQNLSSIRLINPLNFYAAIGNKAIAKLEDAIGKKSTQLVSQAMQSPQTAADLLAALPANERSRVLRLLRSPEIWAKGAPAAAGAAQAPTNALAPEAESQNALAR